MKKSLIAGAGIAALAMAALPFAGVFAETTVKDNLTVTVNPFCELANITPSGTSGTNPNNYYGVGNPGTLVSLAAGTKASPSTGTATSITINCNDANGYTVTPTFTALMLNGTTSAQDIAYNGATAATAGSQTWTAYQTKSGTKTAINGAFEGGSTMTDTYTFSYEAGLGANQAAGDYTGSATYTLAAKAGS